MRGAVNQTGRDLFANVHTLSLNIGPGAVADLAGNLIDASVSNTVLVYDTTKPAALSAIYRIGNGTMSVQFSEAIMPTNGIPMNITYSGNALSLQGATTSDDAVTATLGFEDRVKISQTTSLNLTIPAGAVQDMHGNRMDAVSDMPMDIALDSEELGFAAAASAGAASFGANDFVTTWNTTAANESITINVDGHTGNYTVNWGDETTSTHVGNAAHTYVSAGSYNVSISGDFERVKAGDSTNAQKLVALVQWGNASWNSMDESFRGASNMVYKAADTPDLSRVTNMSGTFWGASSFDGDLSKWNVSAVTNMRNTFAHASSFNGDISTWDVSAVTTMRSMFWNAPSFNGDLSKWNVSAVTTMRSVFAHASSFNGDISTWDVSAATKMHLMFLSASSFNGDLSKWNVSKVTDMSHMFNGASAFNGNISAWDVSRVTDMEWMFARASSFNSSLSSWDVSRVTNLSYMFYDAHAFNSDLSSWDVSRVTGIQGVFKGASAFNSDLSSWDVSRVTDMSYMFDRASAFNSDLSSWDVSKVTDMAWMFTRASAFNSDLSSWDVSRVTDMSYIFYDAHAFNSDLSSWDVSKVTDMARMFDSTYTFNSDLSSWDVSKVTDMNYMFASTRAFNSDLSSWDVSKVTDMGSMFRSASSFNSDLSSWDVSKVTDMSYMFLFAASFNSDLSTWNVSSVTDIDAMFFGASSFNSDLSSWDVSSMTSMTSVFYRASSFNQNLGSWYATLDNNALKSGNLTVGNITAQNAYLQTYQSPTYSLVDGTGDADNSLFEITGNTLRIKQTPAKSAYSIRIDVDGGFYGQNNAVVLHITADDGIKPTVSSASYYAGTGILTVSFSEPLDSSKHDASKFHIRNAGQSTGGVTLSNGTITTNGTDSLTFTLNTNNRTSVNAMTSSQMDIDAGAVSDTAGNTIAAAPDQTIANVQDNARPTFASATYNSGSGVLTVTFSEDLDSSKHDASKFHIRNASQSTGGVTLSSGTVTHSGTDSITFTLGTNNKTSVNTMTTPQLDIDAGAVRDFSGNQIAAAADQTITVQDTTRPTFTSATYNAGTGMLTVTFSEQLDSSRYDASKIHIRNASETLGGVTLSNDMITNNDTSSLTFTLKTTDRTTVNALAAPQLDIGAAAVSDVAGNPISTATDQDITVIRDTIKPTFTSAAYNSGSGVLTVTFSEPLDSSKHDASKFHIRNAGQSTGGITMSDGTITNNGTDSLTFTLSANNRTSVNALAAPPSGHRRGSGTRYGGQPNRRRRGYHSYFF